MHIGVDLDNTLISYDGAFHTAAVEILAVPVTLPRSKAAIKEHVLARHGNDTWTRLQAEVYGPRIHLAGAFPGVEQFLRACSDTGHTVSILSHKTRRAALGGSHDLHEAALSWLERQKWYSGNAAGLDRSRVHFFPTRSEKVCAIRDLGCELFIDDLAEVFSDPAFPLEVPGILFRPEKSLPPGSALRLCESWAEIGELLFGGVKA